MLNNYYIYIPNRNLLFYPDETNLTLYAYNIDLSINIKLIKINSNFSIKIYKKYYLEYNIWISYNNYY